MLWFPTQKRLVSAGFGTIIKPRTTKVHWIHSKILNLITVRQSVPELLRLGTNDPPGREVTNADILHPMPTAMPFDGSGLDKTPT